MDDLDRQIAELRAFTGVNPDPSQQTAAAPSQPDPSPQPGGDDLDQRIAELRAFTGVGPNAAPKQDVPGGWGAFGLNVGRGILDVGRGARQFILNSAAAIAPEGAPVQQITRDVNRQVSADRAEEARLMQPVEEAHPYASAGGRLVGNAAATAPLAIVAPGGAATAFLPRVGNFAAQGALGATVEPVDTEQSDGYWGEKAKQVVTGAGAGAGVGGGLHVAGHAIGQTLNFPRTIYNRLQQKAMETPYAREGERVAAETGMDLTPAMVSGSRAARQAENLAQQSMWSSDHALKTYQKLTDQAEAHANDLIGRLSGGRGAQSASVVGSSLRKATTDATEKIFNIADSQWKRDAAEIYQAAPESFDLTNTRQALESIKDSASLTEIGGIIKSKAIAQLGRLDDAAVANAAKAGRSQPILTIDDAMNLRRDFAKAAKGSGIIFQDLHPAENRRYAIQLFSAIEKDFDSKVNNADGPVGDALRAANANYKKAMESIDYIRKSTLGKLLGNDVADSLYTGNSVSSEGLEKLTKSVLRMEPSELTQVRNILEQHAPDVLQDWKAWTLAEAMRKGEALSPSMGTRIRFDPAKAAGGLMRPDQRAALFTAEENRWLGTFDEALRRWSDKFGFNTSWTAPASETMSVLKRTGIGVGAAIPTLASGAMGGAAAMGSGVPSVWLSASYAMGMREIANAMLNPGDRRQLLSILKSPPGSRLATRGIAHLSSKYANQAAAQAADDGPKQDAAANDYGNGQ